MSEIGKHYWMSDTLEGLSHHMKMQRVEKEREIRDEPNKPFYSLVQ